MLDAFLNLGGDFLFQKAVRNAAKTRFGDVVVPAIARDVVGIERVDAFQKAYALAGGSFADLQTLDNLVQSEGTIAGEKETVNFAIGFGQANGLGGIDEESDQFPLEFAERFFGAGRHFFR